jgi:hypothetical protein
MALFLASDALSKTSQQLGLIAVLLYCHGVSLYRRMQSLNLRSQSTLALNPTPLALPL